MQAISPKLKIGLGLAAAAAVFSVVRGGGDEPLIGETFDSPLAFVVENEMPTTTWAAPPVTRNPFASGEFRIDDDAVEDLTTETTLDPATVEAGEPSFGTTPTTLRTLDTTNTTLSLAETIDRRLPPGAQTTTTLPPGEGQTSTTNTGAPQLDG